MYFISKTKISIGVNQSYTLKLSNNKKKIKWSSNKKSVATVNSRGKVTGKKKGTAVITAKVGKTKYRCTVTVKKPTLSKTKLLLNEGKGYTLKLLYNKSNVKWSSSKKSVATVNSKGKVTGKKKGTAVITATVGKYKYKCNVTVNHNHVWTDVTETVNHPAVTHKEDIYGDKQVCVKDAYDEKVYTGTILKCAQCGYQTSDQTAMGVHAVDEGHNYTGEDIYETVHHDAIYETKRVVVDTKTVIDKPAWTETVTKKKCKNCTATK